MCSLALAWTVATIVAASEEQPATSSLLRASKPNVVFILADDLGYGDLRCLNPEGKIATPHLDRLAAEGMRFTDAHSSSSVCTPTRYSLLTGRYNWRSRLKNGVLGGLSPPLIEPQRWTLASLLKRQGYHSTCIGKWHLGLDWVRKPKVAPFGDVIEKGEAGWSVDFTQPFGGGPTTVGFDEFFGIAASLDMIPYTYLSGDRVVKLPTVDMAFEMMQGDARQMTRKGPGAEGFSAADVLPEFTKRTIDYLERRAPAAREGRPFFVYLPLASPHTPIAATPDWLGKSGLNPYADFVQQTDHAVGQVLAALERLQLADDTLVVFTSDNGCSPQADFPTLKAGGHNPNYAFRGHKADIFEGGHWVPLIVRWPGVVRANSTSDRLVGLVDWFATLAQIVGQDLPDDAGEDSVNFLETLKGAPDQAPRPPLVHHSINGSFAIRDGDWKLILCSDSGGWSDPKPGSAAAKMLPKRQLYNLRTDLGERLNLATQHPETVERLERLLKEWQASPRSIARTSPPSSADAARAK